MATQAEQMMKMLEGIGGSLKSLTERMNAVENAATEPTPQPTKAATPAPTKASGTATKAATLKRNLDPVDVDATEGLLFRVIAANGGGVLTNGSRAVPVTVDANGKERIARSLTAEMLTALTDDVRESIRDAMATVDKRAHIGAHKPTITATAS